MGRQSDQHGNPVPDDLVFLDLDPSQLMPEGASAVCGVGWYESPARPGAVLVSARALQDTLDGFPYLVLRQPGPARPFEDDMGEVLYIPAANRRWSGASGFHNSGRA